MSRLTREKDQWECRVLGGCQIEEYIARCANVEVEDVADVCIDCPLMPIVNALAEYEDREGLTNE